MKIEKNEIITTTYITFDGMRYESKDKAMLHELATLTSKFEYVNDPNIKYYLCRKWGKEIMFCSFVLGKQKRPLDYRLKGNVSSIKSSKAFDSIKDLYNVITINNEIHRNLDFDGKENYGYFIVDSNKAKEIDAQNTAFKETVKEKTQPYLKVMAKDENPSGNGEYITNLGMLEYFDGSWDCTLEPVFWMKKVKKTDL